MAHVIYFLSLRVYLIQKIKMPSENARYAIVTKNSPQIKYQRNNAQYSPFRHIFNFIHIEKSLTCRPKWNPHKANVHHDIYHPF